MRRRVLTGLGVGLSTVLIFAGCGGGLSGAPTTTTIAGVFTIEGKTYSRAEAVSAVGPGTLQVNGLDYVAPFPLSDYPKDSVVVFGPGHAGPYIWTGTSLVLLAPPCAVMPQGEPGAG